MKIPPHAKLIFKGVIFDIYQWEQKMFDGTTATFEMAKRPDTSQVIATRGDKIIICHQEQPDRALYLSLFGGRIERGEEPLVGAKRELQEEAGLASEQWKLLRTHNPSHKIDWTIYYYIAKNCKIVAEPHLDSGEKIELLEISFDEFVQAVTNDKLYSPNLANNLLRAKLDPPKLEEFRRQLFD